MRHANFRGSTKRHCGYRYERAARSETTDGSSSDYDVRFPDESIICTPAVTHQVLEERGREGGRESKARTASRKPHQSPSKAANAVPNVGTRATAAICAPLSLYGDRRQTVSVALNYR